MATIMRFLDVDPNEDLENESPVNGLQDAEDLTALEACTRAKAACPVLATWDLNLALAAAGRAVKRLEKRGELAPLTREEAFAVHVYTQDSWFYQEVNRRLRLRERQSLKPFFPYLKLFLTGLHRLEPVDDTVFRGVKLDLAAKYGVDDEFVWWAFSSATATAAVLSSDEFLGETGPRTLFSINVRRCVNIRRYSAMGGEDERLILPGTAFRVKSQLPLGAELIMIQVEEDKEFPQLISGFAFASPSASTADGQKMQALFRVLEINNQNDCAYLEAAGIKGTDDLLELEIEDITEMAQALSLATKKRLTRFAQLSPQEKKLALEGSSAAAPSAPAASSPPRPQAQEALKRAIASADAGAIVKAMREHAANAAIQREGCEALWSLAFKSDQNRGQIARVGGIEALLTAMQGHPTDPGVQQMACGALRNIALTAENQGQFARLGGIEALLKVMKDQPTHPGVQEQACAALLNLSLVAENKVKIGNLGGIEALLTAMKDHPAHPGVQEAACAALCSLAANHAENQVKISKLGGIEALLKAMKDHPAHPGVQEQACGALRNLAFQNPENKVKIPNLGGIEALIKAMKDHPAHPGVQEHACGALHNLSLVAENKVKISNLGAEEPVRRAMAAANATEDTKKWGQVLLDWLAQC